MQARVLVSLAPWFKDTGWSSNNAPLSMDLEAWLFLRASVINQGDFSTLIKSLLKDAARLVAETPPRQGVVATHSCDVRWGASQFEVAIEITEHGLVVGLGERA